MAEFDPGLPSIRQLQQWVADKQAIEMKLTTGDTLSGTALWQDAHCICLLNEANQPIVVWRHAIAYHKPLA